MKLLLVTNKDCSPYLKSSGKSQASSGAELLRVGEFGDFKCRQEVFLCEKGNSYIVTYFNTVTHFYAYYFRLKFPGITVAEYLNIICRNMHCGSCFKLGLNYFIGNIL